MEHQRLLELHEALAAEISCTFSEVATVFSHLFDHERKLSERADTRATQKDTKALRAIADDLDKAIRRAEALPQDSGAAFVLLTGNLPSLTELRRMRDHLRGYADLVSDNYVSKIYPAPNGRKEQARVVAKAVALMFAAKGERMGCGKLPDGSGKPSGPFGRAVKAALAVFEIDANSDNAWFRPAKEAAAQHDNTN
ncbi:hypothetical protein ACGYLX_04875 [Sulfitobacter sp. 1A13496]|uniref:hypothetical protein n=1 Tax=Sulfitobacter sp. 1A13496 TaxID=3368596 RepID=UPI00374516FC